MKWKYLFAVLILASFGAFWFWGGRVLGVNIPTQTIVSLGANLTQRDYRWYSNINSLTPTTALTSENASFDTPGAGSVLRLRMNLTAGVVANSGLTFKLQFSNSTSSGFADLGTSTAWIFNNNSGVADGAIIVTTLLTNSDVGESYGESNPSAASPNALAVGEDGEWDWALLNNAATTSLSWYFRMVFSSGTAIDSYTRYPTLSAVSPATSSPPAGGGTPGGGGALLFPLPISLPDLIPGKPKIPSPCDNVNLQRVDLSGDCLVDLIDLSILLYYYEREGPAISRYDFNDNNRVDFPDVSVMMFYWTG